MSPTKWTALSLVLFLGLSMTPLAYALADCAMQLSPAVMAQAGCGGASGCCGCEVANAFPVDSMNSVTAETTRLIRAILFDEVEQHGNLLRSSKDAQPSDPREERSSHPEKLYDLYSDHRL